jgi:signal transduction histidine kinase/ActR/RegA family two-component response regulator
MDKRTTEKHPVRISLRDSIAYNLLKVVFAIYFLFAVSITGYHMYLDYQTAERHIIEQLGLIEKAFENSLSTALFDLDAEQLQSIMEGLHEMHALVGVELRGSNPDIYIPDAAIGVISPPGKSGTIYVDRNGEQLPSNVTENQLITHPFVLYQPDTDTEIARGTLYSSSSVVFSTVESSFIRLIISAAVKTFLLWLLFLWAAAGRLSQPLRDFAMHIANLDMRSRPDGESRRLPAPAAERKDELHLLSRAFATMQRRLQGHVDALHTQIKIAEIARCEAEAANRAKSEFLAKMSHELRTPMNGVIGSLEVLRTTELSERQTRFTDHADNSARHLLDILNDILDFSKIEAGHLDTEQVDFSLSKQVLDPIVELAQQQIRDKRLDFGVDTGLDVIDNLRGDPLRLRQVLSNLVDNAVKFTDSGAVQLRIRQVASDPDAVRLRFEVIDTGIGLTEAEAEDIFNAFRQADNSVSRKYGGTGLGLSICQQLVELMDGEIGVKSRSGHGSTFWIELPLARGADSPGTLVRQHDQTLSPRPARPALRILVVEDNLIDAAVLEAMLWQLDCVVRLCGNGEEALSELESDTFDIVLMDCQMPVMDGYEATRQWRLRENERGLRRTPIIAVTANALDNDRIISKEAGMDDHLSKPYVLDELAALLSHWHDQEIVNHRTKTTNPDVA